MNDQKTLKIDLGILKKFSPFDICILSILVLLMSVQLIYVLYTLNKIFLIETPIHTGELSIETIDTRTYSNPTYAISEIEEDINRLVHASLAQQYDGNLRPQLAERIIEDEVGIYRVILREKLTFHDGQPISIEDAVFTIQSIQEDPENPYFETWSGVQVEQLTNREIRITVPEENISFPKAFTTPILPSHIWKKVTKESTGTYKGPGHQVGAGPFILAKEEITIDGRPEKITLSAFKNYAFGEPYIQTIHIDFFEETEDLLTIYKQGNIDIIHGVTPSEIPAILANNKTTDLKVHSGNTNRVFGLFYNLEDDRILRDPFLRSSLSESLERQHIVEQVFDTYANPISTPLANDDQPKNDPFPKEEIIRSLDDLGWKLNSETQRRERQGLPFSISFIYPNIEETRQIAKLVIEQWQEIGVEVESRALSPEILQTVSREGSFDVVLLGYAANSYEDLPHIWKSGTEENIARLINFGTPHLNALLEIIEKKNYPANLEGLLKHTPDEEIEQLSTNQEIWKKIVYNEIKVEIEKNVPVTFLYSPKFFFIVPENLQNLFEEDGSLGFIEKPSDRLSNVHNWFVQKEKIWSFLVEKRI